MATRGSLIFNHGWFRPASLAAPSKPATIFNHGWFEPLVASQFIPLDEVLFFAALCREASHKVEIMRSIATQGLLARALSKNVELCRNFSVQVNLTRGLSEEVER